MRYATVLKFIAVILCAATLMGAVGSAAGIFFLTELGGKSVYEHYVDQLENQSIGYAMNAGGVHVSEALGSVPKSVINQHWGNDWESVYFDWTRVGYTLYDGDNTVLQEKDIPSGRTAENTFTIPVSGQYMKLVGTMPREEYNSQFTSSSESDGARVHVMPSQESTPIGAIYVDYSDGHQQEWPLDSTQLGLLLYTGGSTLTFVSNIGDFPAGDGWYPIHILMLDMGGNAVYEASADTCVVQASELDENGVYCIYLPSGTITIAAPIGVTYTDGDYTSYDAIPTQGITVTQMNVTYGTAEEGDIGSEGIATPDLLGTLFHDHQGNAEFHSVDPMTLDIPDGNIITRISFMDAGNNLVYEAGCPRGVGVLINDENGYLVFRGEMPGTVVEEPLPPETVPEETEAPAQPEGQLGFAETKTDIYNMPSSNGTVVGFLEPGQEFRLLQQERFSSGGESKPWGLIKEGWILLENVLLAESTRTETIFLSPNTAAAEEETVPEETVAEVTEPAAVLAKILVPEATVPPTEPVIQDIPIPAEIPVAAADTMAYPEEDVNIGVYYDAQLRQDMVAQYVMEPIPAGFTMEIRLAKGALRNEFAWTLLYIAEAFRSILLEALGICIAVFALCVVHLCCSAGRTRRNNDVRAGGLNRIPLDLYLCIASAAEVGLIALAMTGCPYLGRNDDQLAVIFFAGCCYLISLVVVAFFFAFVAQIKTPGGYWWRNSICGRCIRLVVLGCRKLSALSKTGWKQGKPLLGRFFPWLGRTSTALWLFVKQAALWLWDTGKRLLTWLAVMTGKSIRWSSGKLGRFFGMLPITWQFLATGFALVVLLYGMMRTYKVGYILLGFGIFFAVILYAASAFAILLESAKKMSKGDLDTKVDDRMLVGGFREFAEKLNDLAGVAMVAAQKQLKSERMKTELITNVSHDIKTPLTSIINYVDLLRKPHTDPQQEQYLEVLDRQSQRLKKLVDDLMEMSKASSGNMAVDIERLDAGETVNQALGEFADKLDRAQLLPVFRQPEDPVYMMADGRLVWRIMSNLLGNAVKYALPGTRIYLDLLEMDGKVIISMKNISREELNVNADELMERFVRGDTSRNTEGSGLGLNIAQSLMELQRGQLQILVDGDLFKVTLIFPGA